jgi:hypothetical protein
VLSWKREWFFCWRRLKVLCNGCFTWVWMVIFFGGGGLMVRSLGGFHCCYIPVWCFYISYDIWFVPLFKPTLSASIGPQLSPETKFPCKQNVLYNKCPHHTDKDLGSNNFSWLNPDKPFNDHTCYFYMKEKKTYKWLRNPVYENLISCFPIVMSRIYCLQTHW